MKHLKERRTALGLSREQLAGMAGVAAFSIWRWETNRSPTRPIYAAALEAALTQAEAEAATMPPERNVARNEKPA